MPNISLPVEVDQHINSSQVTTYPPPYSNIADSGSVVAHDRTKTTTNNNFIRVGLYRFDASSIPQDATILSVGWKFGVNTVNSQDPNTRNIIVDDHQWSGGSSDYNGGVAPSGIGSSPLTTISPSVGSTFTLVMDSIPQIVGGKIYLRVFVDGGEPSGQYTNRLYVTPGTSTLEVEYTVPDTSVDTSALFAFQTPSTRLVGTQTFRAYLRKYGAGDDPTARLELWENNTFISNITSDTLVSTEGWLEGTWEPNLLSDPSGAEVEMKIVGTGANGGSVEIASIGGSTPPTWVALSEGSTPKQYLGFLPI